MFQTEVELVEKFKGRIQTNCSEFFDFQGEVKIFSEVNVGFGIADLLLVELVNTPFSRNFDLGRMDIHIVSILQNNNRMSVLTLSNLTGISKTKIRNSLKKLSNENIINYNDEIAEFCTYKLNYNHSYAFEAKLKNWRRALEQAYRYKWFAKKSYVVLPEGTALIAAGNIGMFEDYNVGLISVGSDGTVKIIYSPFQEEPFSNTMPKLLNEMILGGFNLSI